ncbi:Rhodanese-like domain-containing protein [Polychytrium aggregatum]|uniref:Rhodanese-like domain-containing protein n=1 Tax=Polychytrium aggregatum TaxID=110093 RepID=UPI0022FEBB55|nr:Rhodanese-like domain-containing protein [Polychytrium aggregatum]KAI9204099.1 Rhodanese-like domain-containing protein [Polychytrium aggregatum]
MFALARSSLARRCAVNNVQRHAFSSSAISAGYFKDYLERVRVNVKEVSVSEVNAELKKADPHHGVSVHLLDVREPYEWNVEHIPNAIYTGRGCLERDIESIVPDQQEPIVVYCASGNRSLLAAESLQNLGYKNVRSLKGGIAEWKKAGNRVRINASTFADRVEKY